MVWDLSTALEISRNYGKALFPGHDGEADGGKDADEDKPEAEHGIWLDEPNEAIPCHSPENDTKEFLHDFLLTVCGDLLMRTMFPPCWFTRPSRRTLLD